MAMQGQTFGGEIMNCTDIHSGIDRRRDRNVPRMRGIHTSVSGDLTVKEFIGIVTVDECLRDVEDFHLDDHITRNLVLYASRGSLGHLTSDSLRRIARSIRRHAHVRTAGKTAFVAPTDLEYAICRVLVVYIESTSFTPDIRVFRTLSEAAKWIGVDHLPFMNDW